MKKLLLAAVVAVLSTGAASAADHGIKLPDGEAVMPAFQLPNPGPGPTVPCDPFPVPQHCDGIPPRF